MNFMSISKQKLMMLTNSVLPCETKFVRKAGLPGRFSTVVCCGECALGSLPS